MTFLAQAFDVYKRNFFAGLGNASAVILLMPLIFYVAEQSTSSTKFSFSFPKSLFNWPVYKRVEKSEDTSS